MKKTGNDAFTFPLGAKELAHPYHPMRISSRASPADAFLAAYLDEQQPLGDGMDSAIENVNACQYWKLYRTAGTSNVLLNLSWNHDSCITVDPDSMRITGWSGGKWQNLGNGGSTGDSLVGTVVLLIVIVNLQNPITMKTKLFPFLLLLLCSRFSMGQCVINIRGPLLVCTGSLPQTYSYEAINGAGSGTWQILPSSAGTFIQSGNTATVTWNAINGALVFSSAGCTADTIFMQACCDEIPANDHHLKDLSSTTSSLSAIATSMGGVLSGTTITVTNKTLFVEGQLNMQSLSIILNFNN